MPDKIHRAGYVHCNVHRTNVIFGENETGSYLIDYDLAVVILIDIILMSQYVDKRQNTINNP